MLLISEEKQKFLSGHTNKKTSSKAQYISEN
jgi:hypothetical protein